jgi:transcription elongation factor Elf1
MQYLFEKRLICNWIYKKIGSEHYNISKTLVKFRSYNMTEAICRRCGSELDITISTCKLCNQPLKFGCLSCGHIEDEKVHLDCRNAEYLLPANN